MPAIFTWGETAGPDGGRARLLLLVSLCFKALFSHIYKKKPNPAPGEERDAALLTCKMGQGGAQLKRCGKPSTCQFSPQALILGAVLSGGRQNRSHKFRPGHPTSTIRT